MAKKSVIVTLEDGVESSAVQAATEAAGLTQVRSASGFLQGVIDDADIPMLEAVGGVSDVAAERQISLPPGDAPVQ